MIAKLCRLRESCAARTMHKELEAAQALLAIHRVEQR
jgi:hypothetical protein